MTTIGVVGLVFLVLLVFGAGVMVGQKRNRTIYDTEFEAWSGAEWMMFLKRVRWRGEELSFGTPSRFIADVRDHRGMRMQLTCRSLDELLLSIARFEREQGVLKELGP